MSEARLRVGQLARRVGVSTHALRAWESRYGLFRPQRSAGGYRLYDATDVRRSELLQEHLARGVPAGEAARLVLTRMPHGHDEGADGAGGAGGAAGTGDPSTSTRPARGHATGGPAGAADHGAAWRASLTTACTGLDEPRMRAVLAEASAQLGTDDFVDEIVVPLLRTVSVRRDGAGPLTVAHAHFAGNLVRTALLARHRRILPSDAPRLWLACPARELHDLGLMAFGLVAADDGWAVRFFGANTPTASLVALARRDPPAAVVLSATRSGPLRSAALDVATLAALVPTALGGPTARRPAGVGLAARSLPGDIVTEAHGLAGSLGVPSPAG